MAFGRYKAECIGCATTQCSACYFFYRFACASLREVDFDDGC